MGDPKIRIVGFLCSWCSYAGADHAGGLRLPYSADVRFIRVMCSGRVDPQFVLSAFRQGADGVMVLGCHPGDCHYRSGNTVAMRRSRIIEKLLPQLGIDRRRFLVDWVGAGEGQKLNTIVTKMAEQVGEIGPLKLPGYQTSLAAKAAV